MMDKKFVHHRALNSQEALREFLDLNATAQETLVAEGDICWAFIEDSFVIYLHHPDAQGKALSHEKVLERLQEGTLFTLEKLFTMSNDINFIIELKTGDGDLEQFCIAFKEIVTRYNVENVVVDAFSVAQLKMLKKVMPSVQTSLHTKLVLGRFVMQSTFEKPHFRIHSLYKLPFIDYITISYTTTHVKLFGLDIDHAFSHIYKSGKKLNLGSIKSMDSFTKAIHSDAEYIYLRSQVVRENYTKGLE